MEDVLSVKEGHSKVSLSFSLYDDNESKGWPIDYCDKYTRYLSRARDFDPGWSGAECSQPPTLHVTSSHRLFSAPR